MPAASPLLAAEGPVRVTVSSNGTALTEGMSLISVTVRRSLNKVPSATLVLSDGDMPEQTFPLSDGSNFVPGAEVVVKAGYGDDETQIFKGIVMRHSLSITGANDARLTVECRDKAVKLTVGRKSAMYTDQKDSDVIESLISGAGLTATVTATTTQHKGLVQHYCTDWDYLMTRAEANGYVVVVSDGTVTAGPPDASTEPVLTVAYGESLVEFQADLDAQHQYASVNSQGWDMSTQAVVLSADAAPLTLTAQGNIDQATLSHVLSSTVKLQTGALWAQDSLTSWSKAQQMKAALARLRGRMKFQGSALAQVGSLITLEGVGERFSGPVFVTALTHRIADGAWLTEAEFGTPVEWFADKPDIMTPDASGLAPGIAGLHVGVVKKLDADPDGQHRVQVNVPSAGIDGVWARLLQFYASNAYGAFFLPEVGDEVVLGWFNNDPDFPVILGSLYSSQHAPPYALAADNDTKAIVTRCLAKIEFNDKDKVITLTTPGKNQMVYSDKDKSILIKDEHGNKIELNSSGITLDSPKDINITAKGAINLDAVNNVSITSKADVKASGLNVNCTAQVGFVAKGSASAELSASGQTTVKGAMVMIN